MNNRKINMVLFAIGLLLISSFATQQLVVQADATTTLATGDHMSFNSWGNYSSSDYNHVLAKEKNATTGVFDRVHEQFNNFNSLQYMTGDTGVGVIRHWRGIDTLLLVHSNMMSSANSSSSDSSKEFNLGRTPQWNNYTNTYPMGNQGTGSSSVEHYASNASYAVIFPELIQKTFNRSIPTSDVFPLPPFIIGNISTSISTGSQNFVINGASQNINYKLITSHLSINLTQTGYTNVKYGDKYDPNAPFVNASYSYTIGMSSYRYVYVDVATGLPVKIMSTENVIFSGQATVAPQVVKLYDQYSNTWITKNVTATWVSNHTESNYDQQTLSFINSQYGNTRPPTSVGTAPLTAGDKLEYSISSSNNGNYSYTEMRNSPPGSPAGLEMNVQQGTSKFSGSGTFSLELFRNNNQFLEGIAYTQVIGQNSDKSSDSYRDPSGIWHNNTQPLMSHPVNDSQVSLFRAISSTGQEVTPPYDNKMQMTLPFMDHQNSPSSGPMPSNNPAQMIFGSLPFNIPADSNSTSSRFVKVKVNGFDYIIDAKVVRNSYKLIFSTSIPGPDGKIKIDATLSGYIETLYDKATGALVMRIEHQQVTATANLALPGSTSPGAVNDLKASYNAESNMVASLSVHPKLFKSSQTSVPAGYNATTTTPTTPTNGTSSAAPTFSNPLPGFEITFSLGIAITVFVYIRKKKY